MPVCARSLCMLLLCQNWQLTWVYCNCKISLNFNFNSHPPAAPTYFTPKYIKATGKEYIDGGRWLNYDIPCTTPFITLYRSAFNSTYSRRNVDVQCKSRTIPQMHVLLDIFLLNKTWFTRYLMINGREWSIHTYFGTVLVCGSEYALCILCIWIRL